MSHILPRLRPDGNSFRLDAIGQTSLGQPGQPSRRWSDRAALERNWAGRLERAEVNVQHLHRQGPGVFDLCPSLIGDWGRWFALAPRVWGEHGTGGSWSCLRFTIYEVPCSSLHVSPYRLTVAVRQVAVAARSAGVPSLSPFQRGCPRLQVLGGWGPYVRRWRPGEW